MTRGGVVMTETEGGGKKCPPTKTQRFFGFVATVLLFLLGGLSVYVAVGGLWPLNSEWKHRVEQVCGEARPGSFSVTGLARAGNRGSAKCIIDAWDAAAWPRVLIIAGFVAIAGYVCFWLLALRKLRHALKRNAEPNPTPATT